jgi:hypothetical protein
VEALQVPKKLAFYEIPQTILKTVGSHGIKEREKY